MKMLHEDDDAAEAGEVQEDVSLCRAGGNRRRGCGTDSDDETCCNRAQLILSKIDVGGVIECDIHTFVDLIRAEIQIV